MDGREIYKRQNASLFEKLTSIYSILLGSFVNFSSVQAFFQTNVVSFFKLEPRLSFTRNSFENYAVIVKQEPIKLFQLIFAHPV